MEGGYEESELPANCTACPRLIVYRYRSSVGAAMGRIADAGGVNSISNFARSWQRAVGFNDIAPVRGSFAVATEDEEEEFDPMTPIDEEQPSKPRSRQSLLQQQIDQHGTPPEQAIHELHRESTDEHLDPSMPLLGRSPSRGVFASPFSSSFAGGTYGSFSSGNDLEQRQQATKAFIEQTTNLQVAPEKDREPLLLHQVENEDGKMTIEVVGQSTIYQTILNSTNVLVGIGILSLPLGFRLSGWVFGILMLTLAALVTAYTARLLGKCLDRDRAVITYSDIALIAFGKKGEVAIGLLFTFELLTACVALVVLFGDSLHLLVPAWGVTEWKIVAGVISIPLAFVPLRYLGLTSLLGVISCFSIVVLVFAAGFSKVSGPGSLLDPAVTYWFPNNWMTLPLSVGLLMSPWGGHAVFPQLYRDMRHPHKYGKSLAVTFSFTYFLDCSTAVIGLLMFGDATRAEISSNILETDGYPRAISLLLVICIAIIPITKLPLNAQPILSIVENLTGLNKSPEVTADGKSKGLSLGRHILRVVVRVSIIALITVLAIVCPGFDRVMSFMGSLFCMLICICFPIAFYLKLYNDEIRLLERVWLWATGIVGLVLAIVCTTWAFLPEEITQS